MLIGWGDNGRSPHKIHGFLDLTNAYLAPNMQHAGSDIEDAIHRAVENAVHVGTMVGASVHGCISQPVDPDGPDFLVCLSIRQAVRLEVLTAVAVWICLGSFFSKPNKSWGTGREHC